MFEPKTTQFQVRVLFAVSGRVGIFSFARADQAFAAFQDVLDAWDGYRKVAVITVNGVSVIDTTEVASVSLFNL